MEKSIAVLVPCYNEAIAIGKVVADFKAALPTATIYVYDNNSTDDTFESLDSTEPSSVERCCKVRVT